MFGFKLEMSGNERGHKTHKHGRMLLRHILQRSLAVLRPRIKDVRKAYSLSFHLVVGPIIRVIPDEWITQAIINHDRAIGAAGTTPRRAYHSRAIPRARPWMARRIERISDSGGPAQVQRTT